MGVLKFIRISYLDLYSRQISLQVFFVYIMIANKTLILKLWIYENHIWELQGEELYERRSSQLWTQLLQLQKKALKNSGFYGNFLRLFFCNCKSCVHNWDDLLSCNNSYFAAHDSPGWGDSHIKVIGMLVVWLIGCKSQILAFLRP